MIIILNLLVVGVHAADIVWFGHLHVTEEGLKINLICIETLASV